MAPLPHPLPPPPPAPPGAPMSIDSAQIQMAPAALAGWLVLSFVLGVVGTLIARLLITRATAPVGSHDTNNKMLKHSAEVSIGPI